MNKIGLVQGRYEPVGTFKEMQGIPTSKREMWDRLDTDQGFVKAIAKNFSIEAIESRGRLWKA